jgi:hypothetical protein
MANLLKETETILNRYNKTIDDILYIADRETKVYITPKEFVKRARNINYNSGYGLVEINLNLIAVGKNFWLERHEYDGSEWWEYKEIPTIADFVIEDKNTNRKCYLKER